MGTVVFLEVGLEYLASKLVQSESEFLICQTYDYTGCDFFSSLECKKQQTHSTALVKVLDDLNGFCRTGVNTLEKFDTRFLKFDLPKMATRLI